MNKHSIAVSVVMPVYNEEKYIDNCIRSLLMQDYPKDDMEWIFVDGSSTDKTIDILKTYEKKYPDLIRVYDNPQRNAPCAMNIGIKAAKGAYVIRLDAHADYATDYISKCVYYLENTDADNVGGIAETKATGFVGNAIAKMLSSKFGVGNSQFRTNGKSGYVDTVPFGAFKKEVFDKVGLFNPNLPRSEDNDINARIRMQGGKIWLSEDIHFTYYCRNTVGTLLKMGLQNGNALFRTLKVNPSAMSVRHFIPFLFLVSLLIMPILACILPVFRMLFAIETILYLLLDIVFSLAGENPRYALVTIWLFPLFHAVYGLGSLLGLLGIKIY